MKRAHKPKWSFVVMRGADKSVRQFHVSKRSVFAAPTAAVLAVTGCFAGLQFKSAYELRQMEDQLSEQAAYFTQTVSGKDEAIVTLQQEIVHLSRQAQELETKVGEMQELELKLKRFIDNYGSAVSGSGRPDPSGQQRLSVQKLSASSSGSLPRSAYALQDTKQLALQAQRTNLNLKALGGMVDAMEQSMELTLLQAESKRAAVDGYPSEWPTRSKQLTSGFGYRSDPFTGRAAFHAGIDIAGELGDPVYSAADGTVTEIGYDGTYGKYIVIGHIGGLQSAYMHLKQISVREGDQVVKGDKIALLGTSGRSTGPHLHFQIMQKNEPVNPLPYLAIVKED